MEESNSDPRIIGTKFARQLEIELLAAHSANLQMREALRNSTLSLDALATFHRHSETWKLMDTSAVMERSKVALSTPSPPCVSLSVHQKVVEALEAAVPHLDTDRDLNDEEVQGTSPTLIARRAAFRLASAALSEARKGMV